MKHESIYVNIFLQIIFFSIIIFGTGKSRAIDNFIGDSGEPIDGVLMGEASGFILRRVILKGSTVISEGRIAAIAGPYLGKRVGYLELAEIEQKLNEIYLENQYITSTVILPTGEIVDGIVVYEAIERGARLEVSGSGRVNESYIRSRLEDALKAPLNLKKLEHALTLLLQNPLFEDLDADLGGSDGSDAVLRVKVEEASMDSVGIEVSDDENPSIGSSGVRFFAETRSLSGNGDNLNIDYKITGGLNRFSVNYSYPLPGYSGRLELAFQNSESSVIGGTFAPFDIKNNGFIITAGYTGTILAAPTDNLELGLKIERRENRSYVLTDRLYDDARLTVSRLDGSYIGRSTDGLIVALSRFSYGWPDDGRETFFSWQGQIQGLVRLNPDLYWYGRIALQLSPSDLPSSELCAVGGRNGNQFIFGNTVRGYVTNVASGDNCLAFSSELRFTLYRDGASELQVFPFIDMGAVWNNGSYPVSIGTLIGTGVGLRYSLVDSLLVQINYGIPLSDVNNREENVQNFSFSVLGRLRF